jgi:hypothetical protein
VGQSGTKGRCQSGRGSPQERSAGEQGLNQPSSVAVRRGNQLGFGGRVALADALDRITSLTSVNGCDQYAAIRQGGLAELKLDGEWELAVFVVRYLPMSCSTMTRLDVR